MLPLCVCRKTFLNKVMHAVQDSPFSAKTFFGSFYDTAYIQIVIRCLVAFALAVSRGIEDDLIISRNIVIFTNICCRFVVVIIDQFIYNWKLKYPYGKH